MKEIAISYFLCKLPLLNTIENIYSIGSAQIIIVSYCVYYSKNAHALQL